MRAERHRLCGALLVAVALASGAQPRAQGGADTPAIAPLPRFAGTWFEVAGYGSWWQRRCTGDVTAVFESRGQSDTMSIRRRCRTANGVEVRTGRLRGSDDGQGRWKVRFAPAVFAWLPAVWGDFWVLGHDDGPHWFVVGERSHDRLAIYSRTAALDAAAMAQAMTLARRAGFDAARLVAVAHDPDSWRDVR